ncbi:MAG: hypothetical protein P4L53_01810 [Candidatus Obscuribacterales bacterium]|nr:hypothetical protein [Candidatus Obscuribacterales bacterium]
MSSDRIQDLRVSAPDSDAKSKPFQEELATQWSAPTKRDTTSISEPANPFAKVISDAKPPVIAGIADVALYSGLSLAEQRFGEGAQFFSKNIAGINVVAHETTLTAAKYMALPIASAAAYAFSRDFHSLTHSTSVHDTLRDSAALVADSVAIAGATSTFVPKVRLFSTAMQYAGLTSRAFLGNLNQESSLSKELE